MKKAKRLIRLLLLTLVLTTMVTSMVAYAEVEEPVVQEDAGSGDNTDDGSGQDQDGDDQDADDQDADDQDADDQDADDQDADDQDADDQGDDDQGAEEDEAPQPQQVAPLLTNDVEPPTGDGDPIPEVETPEEVIVTIEVVGEGSVTFGGQTISGSGTADVTVPETGFVAPIENETTAGWFFKGWSPSFPSTLEAGMTLTATFEFEPNLYVAADDYADVYVNGEFIAKSTESYRTPDEYYVDSVGSTPFMAAKGWDLEGWDGTATVAGFKASLRISKGEYLDTNDDWYYKVNLDKDELTDSAGNNWYEEDYLGDGWRKVSEVSFGWPATSKFPSDSSSEWIWSPNYLYRLGYIDTPVYFRSSEPTPEYTIEVTDDGNGTAEVNGEDSVTVPEGTALTYETFPATGFEFDHWEQEMPIYEGDDSDDKALHGTGAIVGYEWVQIPVAPDATAIKDVKYRAVFVALPEYTITVITDGNGDATVNNEPSAAGESSVTVFEGTALTYQTYPNSGYLFDHWEEFVESDGEGQYETSSSNGSSSAPVSGQWVTVTPDSVATKDALYKAIFEEEPEKPVYYTIKARATTGGSAYVNGASEVTVLEGTALTFTYSSSSGYYFDGWDKSLPSTAQADGTYTADFDKKKDKPEEVTYDLTVKAETGGTVPGMMGTTTYDEGEVVTLATPVAEEGYVFTGWSGPVVDGKVTMDADKTVTATFEEEEEEEEFLDDPIPESSPTEEIPDEPLPQTGGLPLGVVMAAGTSFIGLGLKLKKKDK